MSTITIYRERFRVEADEDGVWLTHARWSLLGHGATLPEAERDLYKCAAEVYEALEGWSPAKMSAECHKMRDFALKVRGLAVPPQERVRHER